jgi:hypothetical protein
MEGTGKRTCRNIGEYSGSVKIEGQNADEDCSLTCLPSYRSGLSGPGQWKRVLGEMNSRSMITMSL